MKLNITEDIVFFLSLLYTSKMTTTSGGNISVKDEENNIWITPSGIDKGNLKPEQIICIKTDGTIIGDYAPSMEFPFHQAIYNARPDIKAIVHAHSPALVSFSITHHIPNIKITPFYHAICNPVGYANYSIPGSSSLGVNIAAEFKKGMQCVMMENHGAVVGGTNLEDAFLRFQNFEYCAQTQMSANPLGTINLINNDPLIALKNVEKGSFEQNETNKNQEALVDISQRAFRQGIMAGTGGSLSVKENEQLFYITNHDVPLWKTNLENVYPNTIENEVSNLSEYSQQKIHELIYQKSNKAEAIIIAHSPNIMAYAISNAPFDILSIPESWMFLKNTEELTLDELLMQLRQEESILIKENTLLLIKNQFIISAGKTLLEAFDRLEVAEFSARSMIQAANIAALCPISTKEKSALQDKFGLS